MLSGEHGRRALMRGVRPEVPDLELRSLDPMCVGHGGFWSAQRELQEGGCEPGPPREWASGIVAHRMEESALYSTTHLPVLKTNLLRKRCFCSRQLLWLLSTLNNV